MKPGTILEYRCPKTGIVFQWRVHSIVLGAQRQEGLIEVSPVHARPGLTVSGQIMHTTWVPEVMTRTLVQVDPRADADDRIEELEAKLAKAVRALQFISCDENVEGRHAIFTLAELEGRPHGED